MGFKMQQTIEVEIDEDGKVRPLKPAEKIPAGRALLMPLDRAHDEALLLAEHSLAEDWSRPEEDAAWAHLQAGK